MIKEKFFIGSQANTMNAGGFIAVLFILLTPFSTAASSILSVVMLLLWLVSCQFRNLPQLLKQNPVALSSLLLFLYFTLALSYSSSPLVEALKILKKYSEFLIIIVLIPFLSEQSHRRYAFIAFITASIITLLGSYAIAFDLIPAPASSAEIGTSSFKSRITHSMFIAFFAFFCAHKTLSGNRYRLMWLCLVALSIYNLFFIVHGRSGQIIFLLLFALFGLQRLSYKNFAISSIILVACLSLLFNFTTAGNRIFEGIANTQSYLQGHTETRTPMGQRLTYWKHSLTLIEEKPLFGHGTGSFTNEYQRVVGLNKLVSNNPHNEYLMITVQLGFTGLILFLAFLTSQYWYSLKLLSENKWFAQGVLLTLATNCLFNSSILDHTEGHWLAYMIAISCAARPASGKSPNNHRLRQKQP